jgi:hypothetical protein
MTNVGLQSGTLTANRSRNRLRPLHGLGTLCGFSAGAWLGAAEAPTKLVSIDVSPIVISFMMVLGVFLARWTVPALLQGTSQVREDMRNTPHLIVWGLLAGCIWAVANTLTIFVIRNIGLSIAFPLWNSNSLLGIFWGFLLFNASCELADAHAGWECSALQGSYLLALRFWLSLRPLRRMGEPTLESPEHWQACSGGPCTSRIARRTSQG